MPNNIRNMWEEAANISEGKIKPQHNTAKEKAAEDAARKRGLARTAKNAQKDNYRGVGG